MDLRTEPMSPTELAQLRAKEARAAKRREALKDAGTATAAFLMAMTVGLLGAFFAMLGLGVLHSYWPHIYPAMGYWETYLVLALINTVGAGIKTGWHFKKKN